MKENIMSAPASNRGRWWLAIEFEKRSLGRKTFPEALHLLNTGERCDLILESGKTLARAIFDERADMNALYRLVAVVADWNGSAMHTARGLLRETDRKRLARMIACAGGSPPCRSGNVLERFQFLGCHLPELRIGLAGFTNPDAVDRPFWFSFYHAGREAACYELDEEKLLATLARSCLCPRHPQTTRAEIERLPRILDLGTHRDFRLWRKTEGASARQWKRLFPAVVPRCASRYNRWMEYIILRNRRRRVSEGGPQ